MTIGERIKKARKNKGWSQSELGQVLGVSQQMIAQFENSKRRPKLETLDKIASALDVGVLDLLGDIVLSPDADSDHSKTKVNYLATFKAMLESLGYDVEFRRREDLYIIFKNNKSIVFHPNIGWSVEYLCKKIRKIDNTFKVHNKTYRECVTYYNYLLKIPE